MIKTKKQFQLQQQNKYDSTKGEVDEEIVMEFAEDINAIFAHVSAKKGIGIDDLFYKIAKKVIKNRKRGPRILSRL